MEEGITFRREPAPTIAGLSSRSLYEGSIFRNTTPGDIFAGPRISQPELGNACDNRSDIGNLLYLQKVDPRTNIHLCTTIGFPRTGRNGRRARSAPYARPAYACGRQRTPRWRPQPARRVRSARYARRVWSALPYRMAQGASGQTPATRPDLASRPGRVISALATRSAEMCLRPSSSDHMQFHKCACCNSQVATSLPSQVAA